MGRWHKRMAGEQLPCLHLLKQNILVLPNGQTAKADCIDLTDQQESGVMVQNNGGLMGYCIVLMDRPVLIMRTIKSGGCMVVISKSIRKVHMQNTVKVAFSNRIEYYNKDGLLHRSNGPAIEWSNGYKNYYINGKQHRLDGPAVEWGDSVRFLTWFVNGNSIIFY
jgi:hypothetical protein